MLVIAELQNALCREHVFLHSKIRFKLIEQNFCADVVLFEYQIRRKAIKFFAYFIT